MKITASSESLSTIAVDAIAVVVYEGEQAGDLAEVDGMTNGLVDRLIELGEIEGKLHEVTSVPLVDGIAAGRLIVVGGGKRDEFDLVRARNVAGVAARQLSKRDVSRAALCLRSELDAGRLAQSAGEGAVIGPFDLGTYKKKEDDSKSLKELIVHDSDERISDARAGAERGAIIGEAINVARRLANEPGNLLPPRRLADEAVEIAGRHGLQVDVLDEARLGEIGAGLILGVALGSAEPPRMIVLTHNGRGEGPPDVALVGKAVTFDTGGISIKPSRGMEEMKMDMSGGAATIAAMAAIAQLNPKVNVIGVVPAVENMPSDRAIRPGDVLTAMNGKTVEVVNTDAEGRLILGDAVVHAQRLGAKRIVDAATLTGAVIIALGNHHSAVLGGPQEWVDQVIASGRKAGDRLWQLPIGDEYGEQLKSPIADMSNVGGRAGGTITGAYFIKNFIEDDVSWAHLDIAGTAWTEGESPYLAKGATGVPTRNFVQLALDLAG